MSFPVIHTTRLIAFGLFLAGVMAWLSGGARAGFYRAYHVEMKVDEITGLEYPEQIEAFLPGIESLGLGFFAFAALLGISSLVESRVGRRS